MRKEGVNLEKDTGFTHGNRSRGRPRHSWLNDVTDWMEPSPGELLQAVRDQRHSSCHQGLQRRIRHQQAATWPPPQHMTVRIRLLNPLMGDVRTFRLLAIPV